MDHIIEDVADPFHFVMHLTVDRQAWRNLHYGPWLFD